MIRQRMLLSYALYRWKHVVLGPPTCTMTTSQIIIQYTNKWMYIMNKKKVCMSGNVWWLWWNTQHTKGRTTTDAWCNHDHDIMVGWLVGFVCGIVVTLLFFRQPIVTCRNPLSVCLMAVSSGLPKHWSIDVNKVRHKIRQGREGHGRTGQDKAHVCLFVFIGKKRPRYREKRR